MKWWLIHPKATPESLGHIPSFLSESDPRSAREQINANYAHGGGWNPLSGFILSGGFSYKLQYPGDPPFHLIAATTLRNEVIMLFEHEWLLIQQPDGSFEVSRID